MRRFSLWDSFKSLNVKNAIGTPAREGRPFRKQKQGTLVSNRCRKPARVCDSVMLVRLAQVLRKYLEALPKRSDDIKLACVLSSDKLQEPLGVVSHVGDSLTIYENHE